MMVTILLNNHNRLFFSIYCSYENRQLNPKHKLIWQYVFYNGYILNLLSPSVICRTYRISINIALNDLLISKYCKILDNLIVVLVRSV